VLPLGSYHLRVEDKRGTRGASGVFVFQTVFGRYGAAAVLPSSQMADEHADRDSAITEAVRILKTKIPPADHGALDSRVQELMNDPEADDADVITILLREFDPEAPNE